MSTTVYFVKPHIYVDKSGVYELIAGKQKAMIFTDQFMVSTGMVQYVTEPLEQKGVQYTIYSDIKTDPDMAAVADAINAYDEFQPEIIFALGGGSAIDTAKAAMFLASKMEGRSRCCFVAIPTTSGTGTEVSMYAVVSDPATNTKYPLASEIMIPDAAILDAELTKSVPAKVTADTGIDVFTHAIESFVSVCANDFTDAAAEKAMRLVRSYLLRAYLKPDDMEARQAMHHASCLAGMAFNNSGLGLVHGMAHALGSHFHIAHGRSNGVLLPYVMSYNAGCETGLNECAKKYARVAQIYHADGASIRQSAFNAVRVTKQCLKKIGIEESIKDLGISKKDFLEHLDDMIESAINDATTQTNPIKPTREDIRKIYLKAYEGKL